MQQPDPTGSDHDLMDGVRQGDEAAFEALYERHHRWIHSYLWRMTSDAALAADLMQEVFLRVWRDRERWQPSGSVRGYLVRIARRLALDDARRHEVRSKWAVLAAAEQRSAPGPEAVRQDSERAKRVDAAIMELPERMREVFLLKRDAGLTYVEIAERMGTSPKTVDVQMSKALRRLRESLADLID